MGKDKRSFQAVTRARLNKRAIPGWILVLGSAFWGLWKALAAVAQVEWVAEKLAWLAPHVANVGPWLETWGWAVAMPLGFAWLYYADQPPPARYGPEARRRREKMADVLPHLQVGELRLLQRLMRGTATLDKDNPSLQHNTPLSNTDAIHHVSDVDYRTAIYKLDDAVVDLVAEHLATREDV